MTRVLACLVALVVAAAGSSAEAKLREYTLGGAARFTAMTVDHGGDVVAAQTHRLLLMKPDGQERVLASGLPGGAFSLAVLADGRVAVSQPGRSRILVVGTNGSVAPLAGTGVAGYRGDGGPAGDAQLNRPGWLATLADGTLAIADTTVIRGVGPAGLMEPLVGQPPCLGNEGGLATGAQIETPTAIAPLSDGSVVFGQYECLRRIAPDGTISTLAGTGVVDDAALGHAPPDGVAAETRLSSIKGVAGLPDGTVVFSDGTFVRRITPDGRLTVLAGCVDSCPTLAVGASATGQAVFPNGLSVRSDGTLLIADSQLPGVVSVAADGTIAAVHRFTGGTSGADAVSATPDGGFVASTDSSVIRVAPDGTQTTLSPYVGGTVAALPDGGVAVEDGSSVQIYAADGSKGPKLPRPGAAIAARPDGTLLVANNHQLLGLGNAGAPTVLAGTGVEPGYLGASADTSSWGPGPIAGDAGGALLFLTGRNAVMSVRRLGPSGAITTIATLRLCRRCPFADGDMPSGTALSSAHGGAYVAALGRILHIGSRRREVVSHAGSLGYFDSADGSPTPVVVSGSTSDLRADGGDLLFLENGRLRLLAHPGTGRFAVAVPRATLRAAAHRRVVVETTQAARVQVQALRAGGVIAQASVTVIGHRGIARFAASLPSGEYTVRVLARGIRDRAARATTQHRLLLGGTLPLGTATRLVHRAGLPSFHRAHRADFSTDETFTVGQCRRISARRVDCEVDHYYDGGDYTEEDCYLQAVTLQPNGVVTLRAYAYRPTACTKRRPLVVQGHPRWDSRRVEAPAL